MKSNKLVSIFSIFGIIQASFLLFSTGFGATTLFIGIFLFIICSLNFIIKNRIFNLLYFLTIAIYSIIYWIIVAIAFIFSSMKFNYAFILFAAIGIINCFWTFKLYSFYKSNEL